MQAAWDSLRGFEHFSLCDWPGHTTCVLFLGGCNLLCPTCHNGDIAWRQDKLPVFPRAIVEEYITARAKWLDGIVVTGGEPTVADGLADLLRDLKKFGLPIKVDSNGMRPGVIRQLLAENLADAFFIDVKGPFAKYPSLVGGAVTDVAAERNLTELFGLAESNPGVFTFRTTLVPQLTENDVAHVRSLLPAGHELTIQNFVAPKATTQPAAPASAQPRGATPEAPIRRNHAETDSQTRRLPGDLVHGPDRQRDTQSLEGQWHQGPASVEASCA